MTSLQFSTFYIDNYFFGVEVSKIQEIIKAQKMTKVPLAPNVIGGLINLRGQIVTAIELRKRLSLQDTENHDEQMNVIMRDEENLFSLLVDKIGDVISVSQEDYANAPDHLNGEAKILISGVYKLQDKLLLILDTQKAIDIQQSSLK